jgi:hypothetical protein
LPTSRSRHLDDGLPVPVLLGAGLDLLGPVGVGPLAAVLLRPGEGLLVLGRIEDVLLEPPRELGHVHDLDAHAEVLLEERLIHDRAGDPHRHAAERQV